MEVVVMKTKVLEDNEAAESEESDADP